MTAPTPPPIDDTTRDAASVPPARPQDEQDPAADRAVLTTDEDAMRDDTLVEPGNS